MPRSTIPRRPGRARRARASSHGPLTLAMAVLRASRSAMALVRGDDVPVRNRAWLAVERARGGGPWTAAGVSYSALRELAVAEAGVLVRGGQPVRELRFDRADPEQVLAVRLERVEQGGPPAVLVIARDLTERVRGEREVARARELMAEQERMRAVGELASGVAHDLNNVLHAMALRIEALQRRAAAEEHGALSALARMVDDAAARVARLQDLAQRRQDAPECDCDLGAVLEETAALARPELERVTHVHGAAIRLELDVAPLPRVVGAPADLRHVFLSLVLNARDAMPGGGGVRVEARREGERVVARVRDDGPGIPADVLPRVFDPFFTTKGEKGSGLGLAIARAVVLRLGGAIRARNAPGGGAEIVVELPVSRLRAASPAPVVPAPGARVLVVDDDPDILEAARLVLEDLGQQVVTASGGREAIARVAGGERFDVVLCDVGMPDVSGWRVVEELALLAPGARLYLVTGWAHEIAPDDPRRRLVSGVVPKPLPVEALRAMLAARRPPDRPPSREASAPP